MAGNMKGPKKLLLNHITSPHVLIWSAVAVSCSLPGIMKHKQLLAKDYYGHVVPYVSLGKEWIDGSIQQDLPMETMSSCFNVTNFIVSQVNPHVVPFIGEEINIPQLRNSPFYTLESIIAADVRHRLKMLAFLGLFPKIYGQQFNFKQNFVGNVTIVPKFIFAESIGIKAILNPTIQDMERYIKGGQRATWPKISYIRHLCSIEKGLDELLANLLGEEIIPFQNWLHP
jgi:TAG lipase/steryl ester hydrolase/phospholipase A2/LPA acyltransferase